MSLEPNPAKQPQHSVSQSNHLIRAAYELSLNEKRLVMLAITKIDPQRWKQEWEISVSAKEWAQIFGKALKHAYSEIENAANQLMDRKITFRTGPDVKNGKIYESGRWVSWAKYVPGASKVVLEIPASLRKYLAFAMLEDEGFTTYRLMAAAKLRSTYSIRLYELLLTWKTSGVLYIKVDEMKEVLELNGKYKLFSDLRKWVINPSIKDINKNSDYEASWDVHKKTGRKITSLQFQFQKKKQTSVDFLDVD